MINPLEKLIALFSPEKALRRAAARKTLAYYEAARRDIQRKQRRETGSGDAAVRAAGSSLREQARHLDQNHDLAKGVLNVLVSRVAGPQGVQVEPQPRRRDGSIHQDFARAIRKEWRDWARRPEVTGRHDWPAAQRLAARTWLRDGEIFAQVLSGPVQYLDHGTRIPLSLEFLEPDFVPFDFNQIGPPAVVSGIELNGWGKMTGAYVYKSHPGDTFRPDATRLSLDLKRIPAEKLLHLALRERFHQIRGVSVFAAVLSRLDDLKDYEESERIAAKVAASMAAFIKKGASDIYSMQTGEDGDPEPRDLRFRPGMVFDDLRPGEEIGTIDTTRPNSNLENHRNGQLRALAAGTYSSYSSISKNYNGTYSAQRQELIESWDIYGILQSEFIGAMVQPVYEAVIAAALASGALVYPADVDQVTADDALFLAPQIPWVDPEKEATAWAALERNGHASGPEIVRRRGRDPYDVLEQEAAWRQEWRDSKQTLGADPANDQLAQQAGATAARGAK